MDNKTKEYAIEILTKLLIKTDFYERENGVEVYIKKKQMYKDLIELFKKYFKKGRRIEYENKTNGIWKRKKNRTIM